MKEKDLEFIDTLLMKAKVMRLQRAGVRFVKKMAPWEHISIGPDVEIAAGTIIWPNVVLLGNTKIGESCEIEPGVKLEDTIVGNNSRIAQSCKIARSQIGQECALESSCYIADSSVGDNCEIWVNVSMYHADVKDRVVVHRDSRIVWSSVGKECNIESYCAIKYAAVAEKCKIGPTAFIEGEKFEEEKLGRGERSIKIGHSCAIGFKTHISGKTVINPEADLIDANISNSFVGKRTKARGCRIENSKIYCDCIIEENAYIHDDSVIHSGCEIARCEITRSTLGKNTRSKHCSYIGDVKMGCGCNVGAGTVFGNYDGAGKHPCEVGDGVFIGINNSIVSKSVKTIGDEAFIGAHMLVRRPVEPNTLIAPENELQRPIRWSRRIKDGWQLIQPLPSLRPKKKNRTPEP